MYSSQGGCAVSRIQADSSTCTATAPAANPLSKSVTLFGVKLTNCQSPGNDDNTLGVMRKSMSMGNLGSVGYKPMQRHPGYVRAHLDGLASRPFGSDAQLNKSSEAVQQGYASDGLMQASSMNSRERRKGVPWNEEEHRLFLAGLQKLGKGDWRGISRNFVTSRTPTQVASHAQKYFLRQGNLSKRKRRSSLFDIINSNQVHTSNTLEEHLQAGVAAAELNRPIWELHGRHLMLPASSSLLNASSSFAKPYISTVSNVSADLCLGPRGTPYLQRQHHMSADALRSLHNADQQKQAFPMDSVVVHCSKGIGLENGRGADADKPVVTLSSSSSSRSLPSSPSSSSLCRIDETSELSSLTLSIAPPMPTDRSSELALKLEPPLGSRQSTVFASNTRVCEHLDMLLIAGA